MGIFAVGGRQDRPGTSETRVKLSERMRLGLPPRFLAVAEALVSDNSPVAACEEAGRELARDGIPLQEVLNSLWQTSLVVVRRAPSADQVRAISTSWSEETLGYLHQVSCEDPLTGLSSQAHLRSRVAELFRDQNSANRVAGETHVFVVVDAGNPLLATIDEAEKMNRFGAALRLTRIADSARTVFPGGETMSRLGAHRLAVLARRDDLLPQRVALLRRLLTGAEVNAPDLRIWIEGMPSSESGACGLLDELARP